MLKQKLQYDNDLDGETVDNQNADLIRREESQEQSRKGMNAYPSQSELTYVQHDRSLMQSEDVAVRSQEDFALESPKIKLQLGANPVSGREIGTAYFNEGKSEADREVGQPQGLLDREI